jgi:hypothetical protein
MDVTTLVSLLTFVVALAVKCIGFPEQFVKNRARRSTDGISSRFYLLALLSYTLWTLQGALVHDWVVCVGQGVGILTTGAIVGQIIVYRERPPTITGIAPRRRAPGDAGVRSGPIADRTPVGRPADLTRPSPGTTIGARRPAGAVVLIIVVIDETRPPGPHA